MVDIDISQFKNFNKSASRSYNEQKSLIKKVLAGKPAVCEQCHQQLNVVLTDEEQPAVIKCVKGCTDIELSIVL